MQYPRGKEGQTLTHSHEGGVITSPILEMRYVASWLEIHSRINSDVFIPKLRGRETKALFPDGEMSKFLEYLGRVNYFEKETDWHNGILVTQINRIYGVFPYENGFVVMINADIYHSVTPTAQEKPLPETPKAGRSSLLAAPTTSEKDGDTFQLTQEEMAAQELRASGPANPDSKKLGSTDPANVTETGYVLE